jgi:Putative GTPase activating protein for Arf
MSNLTPAEQKVRKLARLPSNSICPNCGKFQKFGFSTICAKFGTFVCNECKSSHQAISHRCKSLTMSSWDAAEVDALERSGNESARNTWLANAPPCGTAGRPQPGDDISVYKAFVVNAYERRMYYGDGSSSKISGSGTGNPQPAAIAAPSALQQYPPSPGKAFATPRASASQGASSREFRRPATASRAQGTSGVSAAAAPTVAVADLLDFGSSSPAAPSTGGRGDPYYNAGGDDDFGTFQTSSSSSPPAL